MATSKSGQISKLEITVNACCVNVKNTKHTQLEKIVIDHNKAWTTSLIRIKGWGRRQIVWYRENQVNDISK